MAAPSTSSPSSQPAHSPTDIPQAIIGRYVAIYDEQCKVCQSFVSWLRLLDKKGRTAPIPIDPELLPKLNADLDVDHCLRELHVLAPDGRITRAWAAVATLARLFPVTWLIGVVGQIPPFSWLGQLGYGFIARNRYAVSKCRGGTCRVARLNEVRQKSFFGAFWTCYCVG